MQFILEYAPIILFFAAYKLKDIYFATGVAIAASVLAIAYAWFATRKVSTMQWLSLGIIVIFGGATLLQLVTRLLRGRRLFVHGLRYRCRAAFVTQSAYRDLEDLIATLHPQRIAHTYGAGRLGALTIHIHLAGLHCLFGQAAGLEETCRPQPYIKTNACYRYDFTTHRVAITPV